MKLDYVGGYGGVDIGTSNFSGNRYGVTGSLYMIFSDLPGDCQLNATLLAQGTIKDIGGQLLFLNQRRRLQWGALLGHVPSRSTWTIFGRDAVEYDDTLYSNQLYLGQVIERQCINQLALPGAYPFSPSVRLESSVGYTCLAFERELYKHFLTVPVIRHTTLKAPPALHSRQVSLAYVGDRSMSLV